MAKSKLPLKRDDAPAFRVPLNPTQLQELGQLAVTWGQIDTMMLNAIAQLAKIDGGTAYVLLDSTTSGPRLNIFKNLIPRIGGEAIRNLAEEFCERMNSLVAKRNHIMHGLWGWRIDHKKNEGTPACYFFKNEEKDIFATDLADLVKRANGESVAIHRILSSIMHTVPITEGDERPSHVFSDGFYIPKEPLPKLL